MWLFFLLLSVLVAVSTHRIWRVPRRGPADARRRPVVADFDGLTLNRIFGDAAHLDTRRRVVRVAIVSLIGVVAVVAGGTAGGIWGLASGTALLASGLWWAPRTERRHGGLTDRERRVFDEIAATFRTDGEGHAGRP